MPRGQKDAAFYDSAALLVLSLYWSGVLTWLASSLLLLDFSTVPESGAVLLNPADQGKCCLYLRLLIPAVCLHAVNHQLFSAVPDVNRLLIMAFQLRR